MGKTLGEIVSNLFSGKQLAEGSKFPGLPEGSTARPMTSSDASFVPFKPKLPTLDGDDPKFENMPDQGYGTTGTRKFGGFFGEEYLSQLQGLSGVETYDRMLRSDPAVYRATMGTINKLKNGKFYIKPPDKSKAAKKRADFLNYAIFEAPRKIWDDNMNDIYSFLISGFSLCEPAFRAENHKKYGYCWVLDTFGWRSQKTIWQWYVRDEKLTAVRQMSWGDDLKFTFIPGNAYCGITINGERKMIPWTELIVFTHFKLGDNMEGLSPLRPMYGPSLRKDKRNKIDILGAENNARGLRVIEVDENIIGTPLDSKINKINEKAVLSNLPLIKIIMNKMKFSFFKTDYQSRDVQMGIQQENNEIAKTTSSEASEVGLNGAGAKSMNDSKETSHDENIKTYANYVCRKLAPLVEYLEKQNFGEQTDYCKMAVEGIDTKPNLEDAQKLREINEMMKDPATSPEMKAYLAEHFDIPMIGMDIGVGDEQDQDDDAPEEQEETPEVVPAKNFSEVSELKKEIFEHSKLIKEIIADAKKGKEKPVEEYAKEIVAAHHKNDKKEFGEFIARRELTEYERKVNFTEIDRDFTSLNKEYEIEISKSVDEFIIPKYKLALASAIKNSSNKHAAVLSTELSKRAKVTEIVKGLITKAIFSGHAQAVSEIKGKKELSKQLAEKKLPQGTYAWIKTKAEFTVDNLFTGIKKTADMAAFNAIDRGEGDEDIIFKSGEAAEAYIDNLANVGSNIVINQSVNEGRSAAFEQYEDDIQGYQVSEILDDKTCDYCMAIDGKTFKADDPMSADTPPYHSGCRGIAVPILKSESTPKWTGLKVDMSQTEIDKFKKMHEEA